MKQTYMILAGASFLAMFFTGIWPKVCLAKFQKILQDHGEDPNQKFGKEKMKELDPQLYRKWKTGFIVTTLFSALFIVFTLLAFFAR